MVFLRGFLGCLYYLSVSRWATRNDKDTLSAIPGSGQFRSRTISYRTILKRSKLS